MDLDKLRALCDTRERHVHWDEVTALLDALEAIDKAITYRSDATAKVIGDILAKHGITTTEGD